MSDHFDVQVIPRVTVQRAAEIIGPQSAAAQALRCVDEEHDGHAEACMPIGGQSFIVVPHADLIEAGWTARRD